MHSADYASIIVLAVFIFAAVSWTVSARKWFIGPVPNVDSPREKSDP